MSARGVFPTVYTVACAVRGGGGGEGPDCCIPSSTSGGGSASLCLGLTWAPPSPAGPGTSVLQDQSVTGQGYPPQKEPGTRGQGTSPFPSEQTDKTENITFPVVLCKWAVIKLGKYYMSRLSMKGKLVFQKY